MKLATGQWGRIRSQKTYPAPARQALNLSVLFTRYKLQRGMIQQIVQNGSMIGNKVSLI